MKIRLLAMRQTTGACLALAASMVLLPSGPSRAFLGLGGGVDRDKAAIERAIARVYPALVRIQVVAVEPSAGRLEKMQEAGSGAIIRKDGYIITNHHVAGKARRLVCRMPDGEEIEASLVGTDPLAYIAVL